MASFIRESMHVSLVHLSILLCGVFIVVPVLGHHVPVLTDIRYEKDGDIIIGGLLNLHIFDSNRECVKLDSIAAIHRVEAMVYTIEELNARDDILPQINIGYQIYDSCVSEDVTLAATLELLRNISGCNGEIGQQKLKGILGPRRSSVSAAVSRVFGLHHMPQITYMATSDELSDKNAFPYYFRAVPPDRLQVSTMIDLIRHFGWTYMSLINTDESYGRNGAKEIKRQASIYDICIASSQEVSRFSTDQQLDQIVGTLIKVSKAKVVIMFSVTYMANRVLDAVKRSNATRKFIWIASDGWGYNLAAHDNEHIALGGFFVELYNTNSSNYENYFKTISPKTSKNPWLYEYWQEYLNCSATEQEQCDEQYVEGFSSKMGISAVIDAVYTYGYALENMRQQVCGLYGGACEQFYLSDGLDLLPFLQNTSFNGTRGLVQFDQNNDLMGKYVVKNLQFNNGKYEKVPVAIWDALAENKLTMLQEQVHWSVPMEGEKWPRSVCSEPCAPGHIFIPHGDACCWDCFQCRNNEITILNNTVCHPCDSLRWPNDNFTKCDAIPPTYIKWENATAVTLLVVATVGLAASFITLLGYVRHRNKPLIKASSRELSFIMLVGVTFSYVMVFVFIAKPTLPSCVAMRLGLMMCFTLTYAPMLTKVIRIYRIFTAGKKSTKRPGMIGPTSQVVITTIIAVIQLIISGVWAIVSPPSAILEAPVDKEKRVDLSCNIGASEVITSVTYNLLLIILCCWFAFKTRKVPDNYNESRFITLSVYTTLVIWLAFIPTYITINNSSFKVAILSFATLLNASVTLICLYVPKLYAVHFVKEIDTTTMNAYVAGNRIMPMEHLSTVNLSRS
ncbi:metabotropic glutamate receptor 3-like [Saccoglossus kowalevskii]|uniref:Metabotropic glutamate receptor 3-like n=1 Tax=Saccoglossus kowalevskii TaxID=10224 RepID=A0ABM0N0E3_SACKO|nr:PREDICTED: metabotropic glutamate receptor 3-like [Saccoglossus kowalevskii]